jgi:IS30 family transposase
MRRITYEDRCVLGKLIKQAISLRRMGRIMNRSHSVIKYEIDNHSGQLEYDANRAQWIYEKNQLKKGNKKKLLLNKKLQDYVISKLKEGWSPENISGRLKSIKEEEIKANGYISHETIYAFVYSEETKQYKYWKYLRRHRKKRYKQGSRKSRKGGTIKNMTSISQRPKWINQKSRIGDWESDSMIFSKQKEILSVQVERKTREVKITKCKNKTAKETKKAIISQLGSEDAENLKTITFDRGTEGALHEEIAKELKLDIYFCHPYCSWEKGAVENRNMFIRQYLPRYIKLSEVSHEEIYEIQEKLNNRPMKCLGFRTPNEMKFFEKFNRFPPIDKKVRKDILKKN